MKCKFLFFGLFLFIVFQSFFVSSVARDELMKIKTCEFAFSDMNVNSWGFQSDSGVDESLIFKPWDEESQEGVFLVINNTNLILEQGSNYVLDWKTNSKTLYNEYGVNGETNLPVINVNSSHGKYYYLRCSYTVGDYRIFLGSCGYCGIGYLTNDFNLTENIIPHSGGPPRIYGSYLYHDHPARWINNGNLEEDGLFPNTEPYTIYKLNANLNSKPSSRFYEYSSWLMRTAGANQALVSNPFNTALFYLNNSDVDVKDYIKPRAIRRVITDEDTGSTSSPFTIVEGRNYSINTTYDNPYSFPLDAVFYHRIYPCGWPVNRGLTIPQIPYGNVHEKVVTIPSSGSESIYSSYVVPHENALVLLRSRDYVRNSATSYWVNVWPVMGYTTYPYLTFFTIIPEVTLEDLDFDGASEPVFKVYSELYLEDNSFSGEITSDDYYLDARIYRDVTNPENLVFHEVYPLPRSMSRGQKVDFSWQAPVNSSWPAGKYYIVFSSIMNNSIKPHPEFMGWVISSYGGKGKAYFKSGKLQYTDNPDFYFLETERSKVKEITITNPDSSENLCVNLSVYDVTDSENYEIVLPEEAITGICLEPLEQRNIEVNVTAKYSPWPESLLNESFILRAKIDKVGIDPTDVVYNLRVVSSESCSIVNSYWNDTDVNEGDIVELIVETEGSCDGFSPSIRVQKCLNHDCSVLVNPEAISQPSAGTISGNSMIKSWRTQIQTKIEDNETYVFDVNLLGHSDRSNEMLVHNLHVLEADLCRVF